MGSVGYGDVSRGPSGWQKEPTGRQELGLRYHARVRPDAVAIESPWRRLNYADLYRRANQLAHAFRSAGIRQGDTIALVLHNRPEWLEAMQAVGKLGARVVPVGYRAKAPEIAYLLRDADARLIIAENALQEELDAALTAAGLANAITLWVVGEEPPWRGESYEEQIAAQPDHEAEDFFPGGGFDVLVYTSGTTGRPKGVERVIDPAQSPRQLAAVADMWQLTQNDVHLVCGPLYHTAPASYAQAHLLVGASVVLLPRFDAVAALEAIARYRVTTTFMVPTHFVRLLQVPEETRQQYDLSSIRLVLHAAAPCPIEVKRSIMELFPPHSVVEFYGASETGFTRVTAEEWLKKPGSVGKPWPGHELRILDEEGRECAPGEVGLVYVRSPQMNFAYRHAPEKNTQAFRDGWFTAGDLGYLDEDGYLFLVDRRTDLILSGGANVYPAEVEQTLLLHPSVADAAVVGVPDKDLGRRVVAVVELRPEHSLSECELIEFARSRLAHYKCPRQVIFVAELPREPTGKIRRHELASWVCQELGALPSSNSG
ncbi:Long-chain-fatty-acid--CoA ligase FadD13 [bacterium HR30]|nr:Long-chain-fatty-acid--CoA ligase FadD13 [bacterium HR30]